MVEPEKNLVALFRGMGKNRLVTNNFGPNAMQ